MTGPVLKTSILGAVIIVAVGFGAFYFLAAPEEQPAMPGSISGSLSYPSDGVPAMRVCAEPLQGQGELCVQTQDSQEQPSYRITNVPPGDYHVYAQLADPESLGLEEYDIAHVKAYYSAFVTCGLEARCTDHTLTTVRVIAGEETDSVDPVDWYR